MSESSGTGCAPAELQPAGNEIFSGAASQENSLSQILRCMEPNPTSAGVDMGPISPQRMSNRLMTQGSSALRPAHGPQRAVAAVAAREQPSPPLPARTTWQAHPATCRSQGRALARPDVRDGAPHHSDKTAMGAFIREQDAFHHTCSSSSRGVDGGRRFVRAMQDITEQRPPLRQTPMATSLARCRQSSLTQRKFVASFAKSIKQGS